MSSRAKSTSLSFYVIIFICVLLYITFLILSYGKCTVAGQIGLQHYPDALRNGDRLVLRDLFRCFDPWLFEFGMSRARYVSDLFELVDIKFRIWLFKHFLPHPTLSLTWLFNLILSPIFLYRLIGDMTSSRKASWIGISIYGLSSGFLYVFTYLDQPAKPLTNFFAVFSIYLAGRVAVAEKKLGCLTKSAFANYLILLGVLFLAFCTDESAWFLYICLPVLFPAVFLVKGKKVIIIGLYALLLLGFLLTVTYLIPAIVEHYRFQKFDFWNTMLGTNLLSGNRSPASLLKFSILSGKLLFSGQLVPWGRKWGAFHILISAYFSYLFIRLSSPTKKLFLRALSVLLLFILFESILSITVTDKPFPFAYYNGALFSLFLTFPLTILLASARRKITEISNRVILILLLLTLAYNFYFINNVDSDDPDRGELTFAMVLRAWKNRNNKEALLEMKPQYPKSAAWLFFGWSVKEQYLERRIEDSPNLPGSNGILVTASSYNLLYRDASALFDGDPESFWQPTLTVMLRPTWITIDFGEAQARKISSLAALPQGDRPGRFFRNAKLLGSLDGENWSLVAPIFQPEAPRGGEWLRWNFNNDRHFRYYKLEIYDGNNRLNRFNSMAELAMYE